MRVLGVAGFDMQACAGYAASQVVGVPGRSLCQRRCQCVVHSRGLACGSHCRVQLLQPLCVSLEASLMGLLLT